MTTMPPSTDVRTRLDAVVRLHDETMVGVREFAAHLGMRCIEF